MSTSCIAAVSSVAPVSSPRTMNRRYSDLRGSPSSKTTIDADHLGALHVADVEALDAQRGLVELEGVLQLLERLAAGGEVAGPA